MNNNPSQPNKAKQQPAVQNINLTNSLPLKNSSKMEQVDVPSVTGEGLNRILASLLGEFHEHKCLTCNGTNGGCINCRKTGYNQTPCKVCDKDGIAFKNRREALNALKALIEAEVAQVRAAQKAEDEKEKHIAILKAKISALKEVRSYRLYTVGGGHQILTFKGEARDFVDTFDIDMHINTFKSKLSHLITPQEAHPISNVNLPDAEYHSSKNVVRPQEARHEQ